MLCSEWTENLNRAFTRTAMISQSKTFKWNFNNIPISRWKFSTPLGFVHKENRDVQMTCKFENWNFPLPSLSTLLKIFCWTCAPLFRWHLLNTNDLILIFFQIHRSLEKILCLCSVRLKPLIVYLNLITMAKHMRTLAHLIPLISQIKKKNFSGVPQKWMKKMKWSIGESVISTHVSIISAVCLQM